MDGRWWRFQAVGPDGTEQQHYHWACHDPLAIDADADVREVAGRWAPPGWWWVAYPVDQLPAGVLEQQIQQAGRDLEMVNGRLDHLISQLTGEQLDLDLAARLMVAEQADLLAARAWEKVAAVQAGLARVTFGLANRHAQDGRVTAAERARRRRQHK